MAEESLCKPCAEANNPYAEVLKVKSRVCPTLSLWTDDDQRKKVFQEFVANLRITDKGLVSELQNMILPDMALPFVCGESIR